MDDGASTFGGGRGARSSDDAVSNGGQCDEEMPRAGPVRFAGQLTVIASNQLR